MRLAKPVLGALAAASLAAGCISVEVGGGGGTTAADRFHVIDPVEAPSVSQTSKAPSVPQASQATLAPALSIRALRARDRFTRHVVRREPDGTIVALDHEYWADEPSAAVTDGVREALAASGMFSWVADASDATETRLVLGGHVLEFCVDAAPAPAPAAAPAPAPAPSAPGAKPAKSEKSAAPAPTPAAAPAAAPGGPAARVRIRLTIADGKTGEVLHSGAFEAAEPLPGGDLGKLGPAMGRALSRCVKDAVAAWAAAGVAAPR